MPTIPRWGLLSLLWHKTNPETAPRTFWFMPVSIFGMLPVYEVYRRFTYVHLAPGA